MKLLLDTHYAFALAGAPGRISPKEKRYLERQSSRLTLSVVSLWEAKIKWNAFDARGIRKGAMAPEMVHLVLTRLGLETLYLKPAHTFASLSPAIDHNDPFDEILLVQAQVEGMNLLTRDSRLVGHPLAVAI
jgi:PIN domain nuclease of toxin-antitoxin system